ncbi:MAG: carboxylating nicotinate-nucleotide diphosphorylase [Bacteroidales bacterium]|nr:carboxylating nicotinate-nucleotide diphosphorylase [Bacteroidales bacterium]
MVNKFEKDLIKLAIAEDLGDGDHTSLACIPSSAVGKAHLLIKDNGILAGIRVAKEVFKLIDPELNLNIYLEDGQQIKKGDIAFDVKGSSRSILQAERLVLNFMQRMSGIASITKSYVDKIKDLDTEILDTRKTTPGLRYFEKEAVRIGGGTNHRTGLFDMIMIKDNHVDMSGGIEKAIDRVQLYFSDNNINLAVEVEARSISDVKTILNHGNVDRVMLDNFSLEQTIEAIKIIQEKIETESSGGITIDNVRDYALCGVDYISVGALTHQILSLDMSLKAI